MVVRLKKRLKRRLKRSRVWVKSKHYKKLAKKWRFRSKFYKKLLRKRKKSVRRIRVSRRLSFVTGKVLTRTIFRVSQFKRYLFSYLPLRVDTVKVKILFFKHYRRERRKLWRRKFRSGFKFFLVQFLKTSRYNKNGYFKVISKFYKLYGIYRFLVGLVKYSRLKTVLSRYGKVFKQNRKKIIRKIKRERIDNLGLLGIFSQTIIASGKKKLSLSIFTRLLTLLKFKYKYNFITSYLDSLERIRPLVHYKTMYIGGKKYKIPILMPISKSYKISIRWLVNNSIKEGNTAISLFNNINSSLRNEGETIKFRKDYHAISFENKAYIHFLKFLKTGF